MQRIHLVVGICMAFFFLGGEKAFSIGNVSPKSLMFRSAILRSGSADIKAKELHLTFQNLSSSKVAGGDIKLQINSRSFNGKLYARSVVLNSKGYVKNGFEGVVIVDLDRDVFSQCQALNLELSSQSGVVLLKNGEREPFAKVEKTTLRLHDSTFSSDCRHLPGVYQ